LGKKRTLFILLVFVFLPIIFYTIYEITSLSDNEKLIDEIYQKQMNLILYSVNKQAWDTANDWSGEIDYIINSSRNISSAEWDEFFFEKNTFQAVIIADSLLSDIRIVQATDQNAGAAPFKENVLEFFDANKHILNRLYVRKQAGYTKIEALNYNNDSFDDISQMALLYLSESYDQKSFVVMMIIDMELFIQNALANLLIEMARDEFTIGIFKTGVSDPIFSVGAIETTDLKAKRDFWLFADHYLGIALKETTIEDISRERFKRSIYLILVLGIILLISAVYLNKSIRHEMDLARMKSEFVSNVSHELRTPLALIRMFAETIELDRVTSDEERIKFSKIIGHESKRLTHIINNILDFSKIEAGKKEYHFAKIDMNQTVSEIIGIYKFHLESKGFEIEIELCKNPLIANADKDAVAEVLVNLIDNAEKYSDGHKYISIKTSEEKYWAVIEIKDRGIGIPAEKQEHIFNKFYRIRNPKNEYVNGSGLGLALVKNIMDAHNGETKLSSKLGQGTRFKLKFPKYKRLTL
jgi:two-component system, OmpR family, phosphate regulon sensor histidine kinase PhoR